MRRVLRLARSGTSLLVAGKGAMALSQGFILVVIARLEGAAAVGVYTLALAVVSPIFLFAHLRLQDVIAANAEPAETWPVHIQVAALSGVLGVCVATAIGAAWPRSELWLVVLPLACAKTFESLVFACQGYWQSQGRFALAAESNIIRGVLAVLGMGVGTYFGGVALGAAGMAIAWGLMLIVVEAPRVPKPWNGVRFGTIMSRWWALVPLGFVAMLLSLNQNVVRLAVDAHVGTRELGIFAATAYLIRVGTIVAQAISQASAPALRRAVRAGDTGATYRLALRNGFRAGVLGVLLLAVMSVVGPVLIPLLYGDQFHPSRALLILVCVAGVPLFASTGLALTTVATGRHRGYLILVSASLAVTAVGVLILTPVWGVIGAAAGWALGETVKVVLMLVNLRQWVATPVAAQVVGSGRGDVAGVLGDLGDQQPVDPPEDDKADL